MASHDDEAQPLSTSSCHSGEAQPQSAIPSSHHDDSRPPSQSYDELSSAQPLDTSINHSTPVKKSRQSSQRFASGPRQPGHLTFREDMVTELKNQYVGPMPVDEFLKLLPVTAQQLQSKRRPFKHNYFSALGEQQHEKEMYEPFIQSVNKSKAMPGFKLINTSNQPENQPNGTQLIPDVVIYKEGVTAESLNSTPTQFDVMELIFEFKPKDNPVDPFDDTATAKPTKGPVNPLDQKAAKAKRDALKARYPFENPSKGHTQCRGQIATYANALLCRQHRTHCYIIYIADPSARIIRFDRSGGLVSALFNYRTHSHLLLEFLWRFSMTTDEGRGVDTSVRVMPLEDPIVKTVKDKLQQWEPLNEKDVNKILEMDIPESVAKTVVNNDKVDKISETPRKDLEDTTSTSIRKVYVWGSLADPDCVAGRATRGYPAWDPTLNEGKGDIVFVKDSWRSCATGVEKETDILRTLNQHEVRNVPVCLCGDDIPGQVTVTQDYANADWNIGADVERFVKRSHIRFAEDLVGIQLHKFKRSRQLAKAVYDAFIAHKEAYEKCGILHRDISAGNILLRADLSGGFLNDWDLAVTYDKLTHLPVTSKRHPFRSGTWPYMSILLLENPEKVHRLQDDAESFLWVLFHHSLRYLRHNYPSSDAKSLEIDMANLFDHADQVHPDKIQTGGTYKRKLILSRLPRQFRKFSVLHNEPLTSIITDFINKWQSWYRTLENAEYEDHDELSKLVLGFQTSIVTGQETATIFSTDIRKLVMHNHEAMALFFDKMLDEVANSWPADDASFDNLRRTKGRLRELRAEDAIKQSQEETKKQNSEGGNAVFEAVQPNDGPQQKKRKVNSASELSKVYNLRSRSGASSRRSQVSSGT